MPTKTVQNVEDMMEGALPGTPRQRVSNIYNTPLLLDSTFKKLVGIEGQNGDSFSFPESRYDYVNSRIKSAPSAPLSPTQQYYFQFNCTVNIPSTATGEYTLLLQFNKPKTGANVKFPNPYTSQNVEIARRLTVGDHSISFPFVLEQDQNMKDFGCEVYLSAVAYKTSLLGIIVGSLVRVDVDTAVTSANQMRLKDWSFSLIQL